MGERDKKESKEEKELREKITQLVDQRFKGDWQRAFDHYGGKSGRGIDRDELLKLLEEADIGNWLTRGAWADGILEKLDTNKDKAISWDEFEPILKAGGK
jgi:hypothetical protein